ncbi:SagB family peptide dehydrogenase [Streptosporangium sp. NBC_01639]|uniref:SagB family peptide dehydrogenase n=1 Tax=Streptosporangium sp. NBC_01639 TaxID=2975948 RepID=UPI00386A77DF|nr:SagB family peptide dehydrogenase [Streptosporangium sp. NBC_01639]
MTALQRGAATRRYLAAMDARTPRQVDWQAAPPRYKLYPQAPRTGLEGTWTGDLLRGLLGLTRIRWHRPTGTGGHGVVSVGRPAPSGGALYPIEAYPVTDAGVCHYDVVHHALETVRDGDHRGVFTALLPGPPADRPDLVVVLTGVFWRNGFKYGDFAYRLICQEIGILAAQALALSGLLGLRLSPHLTFDGEAADRLLGLDPADEGTLAVLTFSRCHPPPADPPHSEGARAAGTAREPESGTLPRAVGTAREPESGTRPRAGRAREPEPRAAGDSAPSGLPCLAALHAAARRPFLGGPMGDPVPPVPTGPVVPLPAPRPVRPAEGIAHRASANGFRPVLLGSADLATILAVAADTGGLPGQPAATALYVLALRVVGVAAGAYRFDPEAMALAGVGDGRAVATVAAGRLGDGTAAALRTAAAVIIPVGDPLAGIDRFGDLWYRLQQAETGFVIHRATLSAAALGLTSRIHSGGTNPATDAALGLAGTPWRSLSFLLLGTPRATGGFLAGPAAGVTVDGHRTSRQWAGAPAIPSGSRPAEGVIKMP